MNQIQIWSIWSRYFLVCTGFFVVSVDYRHNHQHQYYVNVDVQFDIRTHIDSFQTSVA